jgi:site-specific DNA-methyltransferase (adenine-specific)
VLDNTAGVFTTAIACLNTNRKYIVMEKEKEYYNKGLKRILEWEREQKTKLF